MSKVNSEDRRSGWLPQRLLTRGWGDYFIIGLISVGVVLAVVWGAFLVRLSIKLLLWLARWI
jgi:hypothetical protein